MFCVTEQTPEIPGFIQGKLRKFSFPEMLRTLLLLYLKTDQPIRLTPHFTSNVHMLNSACFCISYLALKVK